MNTFSLYMYIIFILILTNLIRAGTIKLVFWINLYNNVKFGKELAQQDKWEEYNNSSFLR